MTENINNKLAISNANRTQESFYRKNSSNINYHNNHILYDTQPDVEPRSDI